jgi:hypothetical protein
MADDAEPTGPQRGMGPDRLQLPADGKSSVGRQVLAEIRARCCEAGAAVIERAEGDLLW